MDTQVSPMTQLMQRAQAFFQEQAGITFDALVAPVDPALPCGHALRQGSVYAAIEKARRQDDPSLPRGGWEHELKRADWDKVSAVAADALRHKSKDLQLAAWLLEAQIHRAGLIGIAPCLLLMQILCERYWVGLYPEADDGNYEFRANIFRWVNDKLLPALRMVPLVAAEQDGHYCWADWEQARRNEQIRANLPGQEAQALEGASAAQLAAAMSASTTVACIELRDAVSDALLAIELLTETLDGHLGTDAPSLGKVAALMNQIHALMEAELGKRGMHGGAARMYAPELTQTSMPNPEATHSAPVFSVPTDAGQPLRDRFEAYARLAEAADFLMRIEPHSPAPYLVLRAVEWGRMNTAELYQEVFLRLGGQLNLFEMLGLPSPDNSNAGQA